jgi:hypothetical protein
MLYFAEAEYNAAITCLNKVPKPQVLELLWPRIATSECYSKKSNTKIRGAWLCLMRYCLSQHSSARASIQTQTVPESIA